MAFHRSSYSSSEDSNEPTENEPSKVTNIFRNDGSFLEMFKKMQNTSQTGSSNSSTTNSKPTSVPVKTETVKPEESQSPKPSVQSSFARRRACKILPVGKVKKLKTEGEDNEKKGAPTDAWAKYLEEVKKYKETYCDSEAKNRSLVK